MKYFTSDGCAYEGMDKDTIIGLRTELGKDTNFVDEATYIAYVTSSQL